MTKHRPNKEPKFHQIDRLMGAGRSITAELTALSKGLALRIGWVILGKWA